MNFCRKEKKGLRRVIKFFKVRQGNCRPYDVLGLLDGLSDLYISLNYTKRIFLKRLFWLPNRSKLTCRIADPLFDSSIRSDGRFVRLFCHFVKIDEYIWTQVAAVASKKKITSEPLPMVLRHESGNIKWIGIDWKNHLELTYWRTFTKTLT